jgi:predicted O-methyltransferase YrrM
MVMTISSHIVERYAMKHSSPEDDVLLQLYRETNLKTVYPRMLSGHLQGKLLEMISCMIGLQDTGNGTFTGYSAICMAGDWQRRPAHHRPQ